MVSTLGLGGAQGVCINISNCLADKGWDVSLIVLNLNNATFQNQLSKKVKLKVLNIAKASYSLLHILIYLLKEKPTKILVFDYELTVILVFLKNVFGLEFKIIARNINTMSENLSHTTGIWNKYVYRPLVKLSYPRVDHIINQCNAMQDDLISIFPKLKYKSSVIYNPVAEYIENGITLNKINCPFDHEYILCVGRLETQKGFHLSIEAFANIAAQYPNLRLKIIGVGSLEKELRRRALELNVSERVDFEGLKSNLVLYYKNAKGTLLTSSYEGFPNVLIESITVGTPIISFDCPSGPSEIIINGINGFLVSNQYLDEFTKKLIDLLENKWDRDKIMETALRFSSKNIIKEYISLLQ